MMKSITQACLIAAAYALEAETEVNSEATYGIDVADIIPSPNVADPIVFPTGLTVGGGTDIIEESVTI